MRERQVPRTKRLLSDSVVIRYRQRHGAWRSRVVLDVDEIVVDEWDVIVALMRRIAASHQTTGVRGGHR